MNNTTECIQSYQPTIHDLPTPITLTIMISLVISGVFFNAFVIFNLLLQKKLSNQELYVLVLSFSSVLMIGPCLGGYIPMYLLTCQIFPRIYIDFLGMLIRLTAGVNVWLTCCISIDRFYIVYYHINYPTKETRRLVILKIFFVIFSHFFVCLYLNFQEYVPWFVKKSVYPLHVPTVSEFYIVNIIPVIVLTNKIVNVMRLTVDRLIPWLLCPATYLIVMILRNRQKKAVHQGPALGMAAIQALKARQNAEKRIRRSRKLVIGISISVFLSLLPETIFDFAAFALEIDLRSSASILSLIWYLPNITDPIICIVSLSSLRRKTAKILQAMGCKCCKKLVDQPNGTVGGTTGGGSSRK